MEDESIYIEWEEWLKRQWPSFTTLSTDRAREFFDECWLVLSPTCGTDFRRWSPRSVRQVIQRQLADERRRTTRGSGACRRIGDALEYWQRYEACAPTLSLFPELRVTGKQQEALLAEGKRKQLANDRAVALATVSVQAAKAARKIQDLVLLHKLLTDGWKDTLPKLCLHWRAEQLRRVVWPRVKPGPQGSILRRELRQEQASIFSEGIRCLIRSWDGPAADFKLLSQGYHLCVMATYVDPAEAVVMIPELREATERCGLFYRRIAERCQHLAPHQEWRDQYRYSLIRFVTEPDEEARFFARYTAVYFGAVGQSREDSFLRSCGTSDIGSIDVRPVLRETRLNWNEPQYRDPILDDINFLRCVLVLRVLSSMVDLDNRSRAMLKLLAQHSRKSSCKDVGAIAEEILKKLGS